MDTALYLKLYPLCDAIATQWIGGSGDGYMVDCGSVLNPAKVLPHDKAVAAFNVEVCEVLELVASNELGGRIEGRFGELALAPDEQGNAELLTVVTCATNQPAGSCDLEVSMWVSTMEMQIIMNTEYHDYISILRGNGDGTFQPFTRVWVNGGNYMYFVETRISTPTVGLTWWFPAMVVVS